MVAGGEQSLAIVVHVLEYDGGDGEDAIFTFALSYSFAMYMNYLRHFLSNKYFLICTNPVFCLMHGTALKAMTFLCRESMPMVFFRSSRKVLSHLT
jgi:hypothetical protein